jgi:hypothetical protein
MPIDTFRSPLPTHESSPPQGLRLAQHEHMERFLDHWLDWVWPGTWRRSIVERSRCVDHRFESRNFRLCKRFLTCSCKEKNSLRNFISRVRFDFSSLISLMVLRKPGSFVRQGG